MPDLSAYISFAAEMDIRDKNAPVWVLTDDGNYPLGVDVDITGIFEITQPDGGVYTGDWLAPDIIYSGGSLQPASIILRLATGNVVQSGTYIIKYTIDHPSYSPTILTRTFTITYTAPEADLTESFDVFTPNLEMIDDTSYVATGYTVSGITRDWDAVITGVGTVTGAASTLSLAYLGSFYDAAYVITLVADFLCTHNSYAYLTIRDKLTTVHNTDAWTPPTAAQLLTYLKTLKTTLDNLINTCQRYDRAKADYEYAFVLYTHIKNRVCAGDYIGVYTYIQEILDILHNHTSIPTAHTNAPITAYALSALCSSGNTIALFIHVVDGTETQETVPSDHVTFTEPTLIGKTILQISMDGLIRQFTQGGTPVIPPNDGEYHFETALGKFWYAPSYNLYQYIHVLYIV